MFKKLLIFSLCLVLVFSFTACKSDKDVSSNLSTGQVEEEEKIELKGTNPLTGLKMKEELYLNKPLALVLENSTTVQGVQTGHGKFDILYETIVEGGITRMLGVTKDPSVLAQVGNVRSAREVFLELACGHDANMVHWGFDYFHFAELKNSLGINTLDLNGNGKYCFREPNGLSSEHTGYTKGEMLISGITDKKFPTTTKNPDWIKFNDEETVTTPAAVAKTVTVPFSGSYVTGFNYDAQTGLYVKNNKGKEWTDCKTGEKAEFKNVFVLFTTIVPHNCGSYQGDTKNHYKVHLEGGTGYYVSNGGYEEITWTKGGPNNALSFKKADGTELTANAGKSYVCITKTGSSVAFS